MSEQPKFDPILNDEEILIITHITQADTPYNQRAQVLLAINEGKSEEEAGEIAGLRATQVKYWAARYRKSGLEIFPDTLLVEAEMVAEGETAVTTEKSITASPEQAPSEKKAKEEKKKQKNNKKKKKSKKEKNAKKSKENKKSKKHKKDKSKKK